MFRINSLNWFLPVVIFALLPAFSGCGKKPVVHSGKLTRANLAKIQKDMTVADVEAILGGNDTRRPTNASVSGVSVPADEYDWKEGDTWISVVFVGGQAVSWDSHGLD